MAIRHGLETAALITALSACSSGNKVEGAVQMQTTVFDEIRTDVLSLAELPDDCEVSGPGVLLCTRQNDAGIWKFRAESKGAKSLEIAGELDHSKIPWGITVDGSCTNEIAGVALEGDSPLLKGGERILGDFVTNLHASLPCVLPRDVRKDYSTAYEEHLGELKQAMLPYEEAMKIQIPKCLENGEKALGDLIKKGTPEDIATVCNTSYGPVQFTYTVGLGEEGEKDRLLELDFKDSEYRPHIRISNVWEFSILLETGASANIASKSLTDLSAGEKSLISFLDTLSLAPAPPTEYLWLADIHLWGEIFPPDISLMQRVHTYQAHVIEAWLEAHPEQSFGVVLENVPRAWVTTGADWTMVDPIVKTQYSHLAPLAEKYKARLHFTGTDTDTDIRIALEQTEALTRLGTELKEKGCLKEQDIKKYRENIAGVMDRWITATQREVTTAIQFSREHELGGVALISGLYHGPETKEKLSGVKIHIAPGLPSMTDRPMPATPPVCPSEKPQAVAETP